MDNNQKLYFMDRLRLIGMASITMFVHVLCGLMRYLTNVTVVLAVDFASTACLLVCAAPYCVHYKPKPFAFLRGCREYRLLLLLLGWFLIAQLVNVFASGAQSAYFLPNALHDTLLLFFVFFPYGALIAKEGVPTLGQRLLEALIILWSLFIFYVLVNTFMNRIVTLPGGIRLGVYDNRAFHLNNNPNHTSCFGFVFACACVFMALRKKNRWLKVLYFGFAFLHYVAMVLGESRAFLLTALVLGAGFFFTLSLRWYKSKGIIVRVGLALLTALGAAGLLFALRPAILALYNFAIQSLGGESFYLSRKAVDTHDVATLSYRTVIWQECITRLYSSPLLHFFGMGLANSKKLVMDGLGLEYYTHNQFIEVAVCAGIPALILFGAFVWLALKNAFTSIFLRPFDAPRIWISACVPALLLANCAEALLMFYRRPGSYLFFVCCGWLCVYIKNTKAEKSNLLKA